MLIMPWVFWLRVMLLNQEPIQAPICASGPYCPADAPEPRDTKAAIVVTALFLIGIRGAGDWPADLMDSPTAGIWAALVPTSKHERSQMAGMGSIAFDERAERMCEAAGLEPGPRHRIEWSTESPDVEFEIDALLAAGPSYTAVKERGIDDVSAALRTAIEAFAVDGLGVRIPQSVEFLTATKP